jgi:hypothetical protein
MYDRELAHGILEKLNEVFPETLHLRELKAALPQFSHMEDRAWLTAIKALWKDRRIDAKFPPGEDIEDAADLCITERGRAEIRRLGMSESDISNDSPMLPPEPMVGETTTDCESDSQNSQFPNRAAWLAKRLQERSWNRHDLYRQGGPHWKTVQKVLDGQPIREDKLELLAIALSKAPASKKLPKVALLEIPQD